MEHKGTQTLRTERLTLRRFQREDAPAAFRNWCSDAAVTPYLTWQTHADEQVTEALMDTWAAGYSDPMYYQWAIVLNGLQEPIGSISVVRIEPKTNAVSIGYCIGSRWWRQGITTEAFRAVIRYLFEEIGVSRIEARHDIENPNSGRVMRSCGLTYEGTLRQAAVNNRGIIDICVYGILRNEYQQKG